ncbi:MAG: histidine kinase [Sphaerochaetaceae bacterium]|nr:histidine kinase [Sphaerochaetaceae bacterium]
MKRKRSLRVFILEILLLFLFLSVAYTSLQFIQWRDINNKNVELQEKNEVVYNVVNEVNSLISSCLNYLSTGDKREAWNVKSYSIHIGHLIRDRKDVFASNKEVLLYSRIVDQFSEGIGIYFSENILDRLNQIESFDKFQTLRDYLTRLQKSLLDMVYASMKHSSNEGAFNNRQYFRRSVIFNSAFLIFLFLLLIPICVSIINVIKRLRYITETAQALSKQEWDTPDLHLSKYEEFSSTASAFNNMKSIIRSNIQDLEEKIVLERELAHTERLMQEAKYSLIQAQINPHFLFNSLNMIVRHIQMGSDSEVTANLLISLSTLLRRSIEINSKVIPLEEELSLLECYLQIQRVRNDCRINFIVEKEESLPEIFIPPFTLQPLVENSIEHGLKNLTDGGIVRIQVFSDEDDVYISVSDNGLGMDKERIEAILNECLETHGLQSVVKRLRMNYSNNDVVRIIAENPGMSVVIRLNKGDFNC